MFHLINIFISTFTLNKSLKHIKHGVWLWKFHIFLYSVTFFFHSRFSLFPTFFGRVNLEVFLTIIQKSISDLVRCSFEIWSVIGSRRSSLYPRFEYIGSTSVRQDTTPTTWIGASCSKKSSILEPRPWPWNKIYFAIDRNFFYKSKIKINDL